MENKTFGKRKQQSEIEKARMRTNRKSRMCEYVLVTRQSKNKTETKTSAESERERE